MAKSIVWTTETKKFEFQLLSDGTVSLALIDNQRRPIVITGLTLQDVKGIEDILRDLRFDAGRQLESGKEVQLE